MKTTSIHYISHGTIGTGGHRHESFLAETLKNEVSKTGAAELKHLRFTRFFKGIFNHLKLLKIGYKHSKGDYNIVTARLALPALIKNRFSKRKLIVVLHNYDETDSKSGNLKLYYMLLFRMLRKANPDKVKIVVVAPFWKNYFKDAIGITGPEIILFPNFFDTAHYKQFISARKEKFIHLGQYSTKNNSEINTLARTLTEKGWYCYFSTMDKNSEYKSKDYDIVYFSSFNEFLSKMGQSAYTLALTGINEGWNRVAHESILVDTAVIGFEKGGLGDLLRESGSIIAKDMEDVLRIIDSGIQPENHPEFLEAYSIWNAEKYIKSLL